MNLNMNKHWVFLWPSLFSACSASAPSPRVESGRIAQTKSLCPSCEDKVAPPVLKEEVFDVFAFGAWKAELGERDGQCLLSIRSFGVHGVRIEKVLDLSPPCYVSRWSSIPWSHRRDPKSTTITHGGPGDAQVWQFGRQESSKILITSVHGFDRALAQPSDRESQHLRKRCGNASQYIRLQGRDDFSLGEAFSSPKLVSCAIGTVDMKAFAIGAEDLFEWYKKRHGR